MIAADFNEVLERRKALMTDVLMTKAGEYASDEDRFHNFKQAGHLLHETPADALLGMAMKHIISIVDFVVADLPRPRYVWDEKIGDAINYLVLLEGLLIDTGLSV